MARRAKGIRKGGSTCNTGVDKRTGSQNEFWALKDVTFDVEQGDVVGLIGANGAGKSTLLKILSEITEPTEGEIRIRGRIASLLEVGTGFHPELSGRENIFMNGAILGMTKSEIKAKFDEIVAFAEVEKFIDTPVKRYSSGMYVRLAFAVAAHLEPEILLVDEVLAVGDAAFQKKCLGKMQDVSQQGRTVLFVSHNMGAIRGLCKTSLLIQGGRIMADGKTRGVIDKYLKITSEMTDESLRSLQKSDQDLVVEKVVLKNDKGEITNSFPVHSIITIELHYNAFKVIIKPYIWISISSQYGHLIAMNMLFDNLRPEYLEGRGIVSCVLYPIKLMPQPYMISIGARDQYGQKFILPTMERIATFNILGKAEDLQMDGKLADMFLELASPIIPDYEWRFSDGQILYPKWVSERNECEYK